MSGKKVRDGAKVRNQPSKSMERFAKPSGPLTAAPDLSEGLCLSRVGRRYADLGMNTSSTQAGIDEREAAKQLCYLCPVRMRCVDYVLTNELPAGSWGGVWGGLDAWNRKGSQLIIEGGGSKLIPFSIEGWRAAA